MTSPTEHPPHVYLPIGIFPEYQNFSYHFDYVTIITVSSFVCFIPSLTTTIKMMIFSKKNNIQKVSREIHPYVFKSFLLMQLCNIIYTILDFMLVRIPCTTLVTSWVSTMKKDSIIKYFVTVYYSFEYSSQLFTVLFCFMRVLVLFNPRNHMKLCNNISVVWSLVTILSSLLASSPHIFYDSIGMQLDVPFQYGAFFLTTSFVYSNRMLMTGSLIYSIIVLISIVIMTAMMVWKLKSLKLINTVNKSNRKAKAETTLTITMFIILIPTLLTQVIAVSSLSDSKYSSYIILVRPVLLDCRVSIVSCYFYWTHPSFKKNTVAQSITVRTLSNY